MPEKERESIYGFDLSQPVVWPATNDKDLFFEPKREPVWFDKTQASGWQFIYRNVEHEGVEKKKMISIMSNRYQVCPNEAIHNAVSKYPDFNFKLDLNKSTNKGDKFFQMVYGIEGMDLNGGDKMSPKLVIKSSYDGSKPLSAIFGFFRMICANLMVIPVSKESVFMFSSKHYLNFVFEDKIKEFIHAAFNREIFDASRERIAMTQQSNVIDVDYSFFAALPNKELVLYLGMLQKYAKEVKIRIIDDVDKVIYNIQNEDSTKRMVERIVKANNRDEDFVKNGSFDSWLDQVSWLEYPEKVVNQWGVFNLIIKLSQMYVSKERRLEKAQAIAKHFLNRSALTA